MEKQTAVHGLLALTFQDLWLFSSHFRQKTGINTMGSKVSGCYHCTERLDHGRSTNLCKQKDVGHPEKLPGLLCS